VSTAMGSRIIDKIAISPCTETMSKFTLLYNQALWVV
jgi:hypothetical protein